MKGLIVTIAVICCVTQLKAQQAPFFPKQQPQQLKVFPDSLKDKGLAFKMMDSVRRLATPQFRQNIIANVNIDNMPIAKPQTRSNIPVVQTDRTAYTMPVVGMNNPRIYVMSKPAAPAAVATDVK